MRGQYAGPPSASAAAWWGHKLLASALSLSHFSSKSPSKSASFGTNARGSLWTHYLSVQLGLSAQNIDDLLDLVNRRKAHRGGGPQWECTLQRIPSQYIQSSRQMNRYGMTIC